MTIVLAIPRAYDEVVQRFSDEGTECDFGFGWRETQTQSSGPRRITFQPGDATGGLGDFAPARFPGGNPRPIGTLKELVTLFVEARDESNPENERAQYQATRELFDALYRALYLACHGNLEVVSSKWDTTKSVRRRGAMIVCVVSIQAALVDAPLSTAPADTAAVITPSLDDVDDGAGTTDPSISAP